MSAPNFFYKNRCVVTTNEDFDFENYPTLTQERVEPSRYYNSSVVDAEPFLEKGDWIPIYHRIVLTAGYYTDGCIDYVEHGDFTVSDYLPNCECTRREIEDYLTQSLPLSRYRVRKLMDARGDRDYCEWLEAFVKRTDDYLREAEKKMCERIIDNIKKEFGYEEYVCTGVMSNGEATYAKADNPVNLRRPVEKPKTKLA